MREAMAKLMQQGDEKIAVDVQTKMADNNAILLEKLEELRRGTESKFDRLEALLQQRGGGT